MQDFIEFVTSDRFWKLIGTLGAYFLVIPAFIAIFVSSFTKEPEKPEKERFTDFL